MIGSMIESREIKIRSDMKKYLFQEKIVKITAFDNIAFQGKIFNISSYHGITIFIGAIGQKHRFSFEEIKDYEEA